MAFFLFPLSCTDDKVKQMISYIIEEPPEADDKDRGYKYKLFILEKTILKIPFYFMWDSHNRCWSTFGGIFWSKSKLYKTKLW